MSTGEDWEWNLDLEPRSGTGCDLVREVAEFWISRTQLNTSTGLYDITGGVPDNWTSYERLSHKGVMGPDEYHASTDNNVYTNVVAGLAIYLADYAHCVGGCPQLPPSWTQVPKIFYPTSVPGGCQPGP